MGRAGRLYIRIKKYDDAVSCIKNEGAIQYTYLVSKEGDNLDCQTIVDLRQIEALKSEVGWRQEAGTTHSASQVLFRSC